MERFPKVSIIIPVYNVEQYLSECLDSVVNQTLVNIEIICVNDGSTDCSDEILERYARKDNRITVINQKNGGLSAARNKGLDYAKGEYIYFLDSDDFIEFDALESLTARADEMHLDILFFDADAVFESKKWKKEKIIYSTYYKRKHTYKKIYSGIELFQKMSKNNEYRSSPCLMLLKSDFLRAFDIRFVEGIIHEDNIFTFSCVCAAAKASHISNCYYHRRVRESSIMTKPETAENLKGYLYCVIEMLREIQGNSFPKDIEVEIEKVILSMWDAVVRIQKKLPVEQLRSLQETQNLYDQILFELYLSMFSRRNREGHIIENDTPIISVIIPVYNAQRYLWECLDSVLNQTLDQIEVICIDDGSTDFSHEILEQYAGQDSMVKLFSQQNCGVGVARNRGIEEANGKYLFFMDADDFIDADLLKDAHERAESVDADIVLFPIDTYDQITHLRSPRPWMLEEKLLPKKSFFSWKDIPDHIFNITSPGACNKLCKSEFVKKNRLKFAEFLHSEDVVFTLPALALAERITTSSMRFKYYYRKNVPTSLETVPNCTPLIFMDAFLRVKEILISAGIYSHIRKSFSNCVLSSCIYELEKQKDYESYKQVLCLLKEKAFSEFDIELMKKDDFLSPYLFSKYMDLSKSNKSEKLYKNNLKKSMNDLNSNDAGALELEHPKVSVIIPVYNAERYLWECLDSLLRQTMTDFEIICVDDGSTDHSYAILQEYAKKDKRFIILQQQNQYAGVARNRGMEVAKGEYYLFLDADDFFEPELLAHTYAYACATEADICVYPVRKYDNVTREFSPMPWTCVTDICQREKTFSRKTNPKEIFQFTSPAPWNKLFCRRFIERHNLHFQNTRSANDLAFVMTALALADRISILDESLLNYRRNVSTTLQATQSKEPFAFYKALIRLKENLQTLNIYQELEQGYINLAMGTCIYNLGTMYEKEAFIQVYSFLKEKGFYELDIMDKEQSYFFNQWQYSQLKKIIDLSVEEYISQQHLFKQPTPSTSRSRSVLSYDPLEELQAIRASWSFRIGQAITWIPRKIRGILRCYREHGMSYTLNCIRVSLFGR